MNTMRRRAAAAWACGLLVWVGAGGCSKVPDGGEGPGHEEAPPLPTNRVATPAAVRENLGITFAAVERRAVASTIRVPGRFELTPEARREHHAPLGGRVEIVARQYAQVREGDVLYRVDSPAWRSMQRSIAEAQGALARATAARDSLGPLTEAHERHEQSLVDAATMWERRVEQLEALRQEVGGGRGVELVQAQASLAQARSDLAEVVEQDAELEARRVQTEAEVATSASALDLLLAEAATVVGESAQRLQEVGTDGRARWRALTVLEIRASESGVVESIGVTNGSWIDERTAVLSTIRPALVRFRARGMQSDLGVLRSGLTASVTPPAGGSIAQGDAMTGTLEVGLVADPDERTVDLVMTPAEAAPWARAGVSGFLEIVAAGGREELAIPRSCVVRDGLSPVIFRRDPRNPDQVIRMEADLGIDDGRWVVIKSGVREGDEIVLDGVYQLMLATSGTAARGGHFHSDGTFHEGED